MLTPPGQEDIFPLIEELEIVLSGHTAWFKRALEVLVCHASPDPEDLKADAHTRSAFGHWCRNQDDSHLARHPHFEELALLHKTLHEQARRLFYLAQHRQEVPQPLFDAFFDQANRLSLQLRRLQLDIIGELMTTDPLTGANTRRGMREALGRERERVARLQRPCCICLMDFDRFKRINDDLGHQAGDEVLRQGIRFVRDELRKYDSLYRYGGEEFLICLPATPMREAARVIERVREGLSRLVVLLADGKAIQVTASFGLALLKSDISVDDAISNADLALLEAKESGRNKLVIWKPDMG
jgi:diguanylate cyclase (GGDEF)-like protein